MSFRVGKTMRLVLEELATSDQRLIRQQAWHRRNRAYSYQFRLTTHKYIPMTSALFDRLLSWRLIVKLDNRYSIVSEEYTISAHGMEVLSAGRDALRRANAAPARSDAPGGEDGDA